jgi:hypothetical protein
MTFWDLIEIKHEKRAMGICYCKELKEISELGNKMADKCIFCLASISDYDPEEEAAHALDLMGVSRYR